MFSYDRPDQSSDDGVYEYGKIIYVVTIMFYYMLSKFKYMACVFINTQYYSYVFIIYKIITG